MLLDLLERFGLEYSCEDAISVERKHGLIGLCYYSLTCLRRNNCIHTATLARDRFVGAATRGAMCCRGHAINRRGLK